MDNFKLLNKSKLLLKYIESNIICNIPKVHSSYRKGLEDNIISLNYINNLFKKKYKWLKYNDLLCDNYKCLILDGNDIYEWR